jgi:hypothetical protein
VGHRTVKFKWRLSLDREKWCVSDTTAGTGKMREVCESRRVSRGSCSNVSELVFTYVGFRSPVGHRVKLKFDKNRLEVNVLTEDFQAYDI